MSDAVTELLDAIEAGVPVPAHVLTDDVLFDATVPDWRFSCRGQDAVIAQLAQWYGDPGAFEELRRTPLPNGELVEFLLTWVLDGVPHAAHQVHLLEISDGRISKDTAFCGGRWDAGRLAEMEEAARARV
jgi:hypothetical protein